MTRGNIPYAGLPGTGVLEFVKSGGRLAKPEICLDEIYELMLDCWRVDPQERPSFDWIVQLIETIVQEKEETNSTYVSRNVDYVNYPIKEFYESKKEKRSLSFQLEVNEIAV